MRTTAEHVIFGTGAIGLATFEALRRRGAAVRLVNRSGVASVPADVEVIAGDARYPAFTTAVTRGARVIYQTLNPPYASWLTKFPALQRMLDTTPAAFANWAKMTLQPKKH